MSTSPTSSQVDWSKARVIVTGGAGFLGKAVQTCLAARGVKKDNIFIPRRKDFDLTDRAATAHLYRSAFGKEKVDVVIHLAAEVGGIGANQKNPGRYFFANMAMAPQVRRDPVQGRRSVERLSGRDQRTLRRGEEGRVADAGCVQAPVRLQERVHPAGEPVRPARQL
jgi:hypothetical protein